jgi:uncharacterized protein (DUF885 family)
MKHTLFISACLVFFVACGGGSDSPVVIDDPIELADVPDYQLQNTETLLTNISARLSGLSIAEFFEESFRIIIERSPEDIVANGQTDDYLLDAYDLTNVSDDYYLQTVTIMSRILEALQTFDRSALSTSDQLSYDVYLAYLEHGIASAAFLNFEFPATYGFFGLPASTEGLFVDLLPLNNKQDADTYLRLLNQLGRRFDQIGVLLETRKAAGIIEPAITLGYSQSNVAAMANSSVSATSFYSRFIESISPLTNITNQEKQDLTILLEATIEQRVLPAYQQLSQQMATLVSQAPANIGFGQYEGGDEFYDFSLRYFTSSDLTAEEVHQLGLTELDRIHGQMRALFDELNYPQEESIQQLYARTNADAGTISSANAVAFFENIITDAYSRLDEAFSVIPTQPVIVIGGVSGGYYIRSSEDGTRPAAFYASTNNDLAYTTMPTLAYHEAVPGHHLQIALAQEMDLPLFRRKINFTSFVEGWGLYAERLASDLNWYQDDIYGDLGRLQFEAMRAARLAIDTGIHSKGWTYDQANAFHVENVGYEGSIARYSVWPGQATAYMTGMLKILELRQRSQDQLGDLYDIKDFHQVVIGTGSMPLDLLEIKVDQYITDQLKNRRN